MKEQTLNLKASLSYGFAILSTSAFALQIGGSCVRSLSSADIELCALSGRTSACVPLIKCTLLKLFENENFMKFFQKYLLEPEALGKLSTELAEH